MLKKAKSTICVILSILMLMSCFSLAELSAFAASSKTVYFSNTMNWDEVYCFMWGKSGANADWPGDKMEKIGEDLWSYTITTDYKNIIFGNGGSGEGNQTDDLILPGDSYVYDNMTGEWSEYQNTPRISSSIVSGCEFRNLLSVTLYAALADKAYYTINDSDPVNFKTAIQLTLGNDTTSPKDYTIKVYAENSEGISEETFVFSKITTTTNTVESTAVPAFAKADSLYAHSQVNSTNEQAWQEWEALYGANAEAGVYYFFLPPTASDSEVELYNSFSKSVIINGVEIKPQTSAIVNYTVGEKTTALVENSSVSHYVEFYKSDSEVTLYINDTTGTYTDSDGNTVETDFYSFLCADKENAVKGSQCTIIDENGVTDTTLKKIKGRGNTTWKASKKPFNITFNSKTNIGGITSKKFSLLSNPKDGTLLRNRILYDFANEVNGLYSSDSRTVDLYINGVYKGGYQITQKVELGKNSLVSLKDESDVLTENFNFLIELDIWNYAGDTYFVSDNDLHVVCKSPDLDGYDGVDETLNAQLGFIKGKYQQLEDALYSGTMSDLEAICDVDSLARAYLLQEFGKNCDGGMTSCYFVYSAETGKFTADPIWDCDSTLGNVYCTRQNATNTANSEGWAIKTAEYYDTEMTNILGQGFNVSGTTSKGESFEDVVKRLWNDDFVHAINVLNGEAYASGSRLKSVDEYASIAPNAAYINYLMWDFEWFPYYESLNGNYTYDLDGQISYMYDWLNARAEWMNAEINETAPEEAYYLTGIGFGGWGAKQYKLTKNSSGKYQIDVTLSKDIVYKFKIFDNNNNYFTADLTDETTAMYVQYEGAHKNAVITPNEDMNVTFVFDGSSFVLELNENQVGDVNLDGVVNILDATLTQKYLANSASLTDRQVALADFDSNGKVTISDVTLLQKSIAGA